MPPAGSSNSISAPKNFILLVTPSIKPASLNELFICSFISVLTATTVFSGLTIRPLVFANSIMDSLILEAVDGVISFTRNNPSSANKCMEASSAPVPSSLLPCSCGREQNIVGFSSLSFKVNRFCASTKIIPDTESPCPDPVLEMMGSEIISLLK